MRYLAQYPKPDRQDEVWLLSHKPVYTQGQAGRAEHILNPKDIPVVQIDRGGQVTYHGPGQLVCYLLLDVRHRSFGVRTLVELIERSLISCLASLDIEAETREGAPGVYVGDAKIGALGLRIKNGVSYHGLSLNVSMDLAPFSNINPCGYENLAVTQVADLIAPNLTLLNGGSTTDSNTLMPLVSKLLTDELLQELGYEAHYKLHQTREHE